MSGGDDQPPPPPPPNGLYEQSKFTELFPGAKFEYTPQATGLDWGPYQALAAEQNAARIGMEDFSGVTFTEARDNFANVSSGQVAKPVADNWRNLANELSSARRNFSTTLEGLEGGTPENRWVGSTHDATIENLKTSQKTLDRASASAAAMVPVLTNFDNLISTIHASFMDLDKLYQADLAKYPDQKSSVDNLYNHVARQIMGGQYVPGMVDIAGRNPDFDGTPPPAVGPPAAGGPGGSPPQSPKGKVERAGMGDPAQTIGPGGTTTPQQERTEPSQGSGTPSSGDGGSGDGGGSGSGDGKSGGAPEALAKVADGLTDALGATGTPPEGVLGLGPGGLAGMSPGSQVGKTGGGGVAGGGRAGTPDRTALRPATASTAAATGQQGAGQPRAGLSSSTGGGAGAGAPAAGARGRDGADKTHRTSDALRSKDNAEEILDDGEAAPPVIGDEQPKR